MYDKISQMRIPSDDVANYQSIHDKDEPKNGPENTDEDELRLNARANTKR